MLPYQFNCLLASSYDFTEVIKQVRRSLSSEENYWAAIRKEEQAKKEKDLALLWFIKDVLSPLQKELKACNILLEFFNPTKTTHNFPFPKELEQSIQSVLGTVGLINLQGGVR